MPKDRFTGFGLAVALLGWIVLVADAALSPFLFSPGNLVAVASLRADVFSVAETAVFSGFALAIIGVLRSGFGALHRFFDAVLERSSAPRSAPTAAPRPGPAATPHAPVDHAPVVTLEAEPVPSVERPPPKAPGPNRPRNYVILANGAVEVETLLGTRVFASLDEARDYIR